jgi:hypothetical protein
MGSLFLFLTISAFANSPCHIHFTSKFSNLLQQNEGKVTVLITHLGQDPLKIGRARYWIKDRELIIEVENGFKSTEIDSLLINKILDLHPEVEKVIVKE